MPHIKPTYAACMQHLHLVRSSQGGRAGNLKENKTGHILAMKEVSLALGQMGLGFLIPKAEIQKVRLLKKDRPPFTKGGASILENQPSKCHDA